MQTYPKQVHSIQFKLTIESQKYLPYYRGEIKWVVVRAICGRKLRFPANLLSPYVTHQGVCGHFSLDYQANGKAIGLNRLP